MGKLGAASRTEAVTLGVRHGLILVQTLLENLLTFASDSRLITLYKTNSPPST
jgi:hypothetical protein